MYAIRSYYVRVNPPSSNFSRERIPDDRTGLAWTAMGGATLAIESSQVHTLNRGFRTRITSYNVCYTKLLRGRAG